MGVVGQPLSLGFEGVGQVCRPVRLAHPLGLGGSVAGSVEADKSDIELTPTRVRACRECTQLWQQFLDNLARHLGCTAAASAHDREGE